MMQKTDYAKVITQHHEPTRRDWYVVVYPSGVSYPFIDKDTAQKEADAWNKDNLHIGGVRV